MSTVKKGILARTKQWAKHLRPFGKRQQNKAERKAGAVDIKKQKNESND
jgi:hypothetical protein